MKKVKGSKEHNFGKINCWDRKGVRTVVGNGAKGECWVKGQKTRFVFVWPTE